MKGLKIVAGVLVAAATLVAVGTTHAKADQACTIEPFTSVTVQDHGKNFTVNESAQTVTAKFKVTGDQNCSKQAVLAVWVSPSANGLPYESQTFFDYESKSNTTYAPGVHTITAKIPQCEYWQVDLLEGSNPKGFNDTAYYGGLMEPVSPDNTNRPGYKRNMLDTMMGGQKRDCTPPPDVCPNIENMQTSVPAGYIRDANGNCVVRTTSQPTVLPDTGVGSAVGIFSATTAAGYIVNRLKQRFVK